jgi:hypothetical protein
MSKIVTLIDADSLAFIGKPTDTLLQIIEKVEYKIQTILSETNADYYALFISQGKYFRHNLKDSSEESGSYKSNRKYSNQNYNKVIKEYLVAQYDAVSYPNVEADDAIAYWMNKPLYLNTLTSGIKRIDSYVPDTFILESSEEVNKILAAVDKDLLRSIKGKHLVYNKKLGDNEWRMEWVENTQNPIYFILEQLVIGDASDGVTGIPGKGIAYWEKMKKNNRENFYNVMHEYLEHYGVSRGIYEFQKNYRLLHLLDCDEDWMREVGYIPKLPNFREVIKQENIEIKNEF